MISVNPFIKMSCAITLCLAATSSYADIDSNCQYSADSLSSAVSDYGSRKDEFESACNSDYGYQKDDDSACGQYGYLRSGFEDALSTLEYAQKDVYLSCNVCDDAMSTVFTASRRKIAELNAEIAELKKEVAQLRAKK